MSLKSNRRYDDYYFTPNDEQPEFVECEMCGESYPTDSTHNGLCPSCLDFVIEEENKLFKEEERSKNVEKPKE